MLNVPEVEGQAITILTCDPSREEKGAGSEIFSLDKATRAIVWAQRLIPLPFRDLRSASVAGE